MAPGAMARASQGPPLSCYQPPVNRGSLHIFSSFWDSFLGGTFGNRHGRLKPKWKSSWLLCHPFTLRPEVRSRGRGIQQALDKELLKALSMVPAVSVSATASGPPARGRLQSSQALTQPRGRSTCPSVTQKKRGPGGSRLRSLPEGRAGVPARPRLSPQPVHPAAAATDPPR